LRLSHVGVIVNDLEQARELWEGVFGLKDGSGRFIEPEGVNTYTLRCGNNGIELAEPVDKSDLNNPLARQLAKRGEGIIQLAFQVEDIKKAAEQLEQLGLHIIHRAPAWEGAKERLVVHPKSANGVLLELFEQVEADNSPEER
jgi:methylmalonyl-CoA epimerase